MRSDSWDIESSVGATALGVTVLRAVETARPDTVCPDPFAARLVRAVGSTSWDGLLDKGIAALAEVADESQAGRYGSATRSKSRPAVAVTSPRRPSRKWPGLPC
ncbi:class I SAM-dependent methyltransferase [Nocardia goodfellowii]